MARSSTSLRSTLGWNSKSKSLKLRRKGKRAKRSRAASFRLTVAEACSATTRARYSMWLHSWALASSAKGAKHSAERGRAEIAEVVFESFIEGVGH